MSTVLIPLAPGPMVELDIGDVAVVRAPFTVDGVPTDPTAVTWKVWEPGDDDAPTQTSADMGAVDDPTHPTAGEFRLYVPATGPGGRWWVKATGTGDAAGAEAIGYWVRPDPPR